MDLEGPLFGVPAARLARLAGVHLTTARRWKNRRRVRSWLALLVRTCLEGELEPISRTWSGWSIRGQELVSPEGWRFTPGDVRSVPFLVAQVKAYQTRERTHLQADFIERRYVEPGETLAPDADLDHGAVA